MYQPLSRSDQAAIIRRASERKLKADHIIMFKSDIIQPRVKTIYEILKIPSSLEEIDLMVNTWIEEYYLSKECKEDFRKLQDDDVFFYFADCLIHDIGNLLKRNFKSEVNRIPFDENIGNHFIDREQVRRQITSNPFNFLHIKQVLEKDMSALDKIVLNLSLEHPWHKVYDILINNETYRKLLLNKKGKLRWNNWSSMRNYYIRIFQKLIDLITLEIEEYENFYKSNNKTVFGD